MPSNPTPDELRASLAVAIGWRADHLPNGCWFCLRPGWSVHRIYPSLGEAGVPDPANDLNAMAAVEAALRERGLAERYLSALYGCPPGPDFVPASHDITEAWDAVTAPAAVRALAAYKVLTEAKA